MPSSNTSDLSTEAPVPVEGDQTLHRSHKDIVNRLKRADGHLRKIITMIENGRGCLDIAQQMHAVIRALEAANTVMIHDHIDHCLEAAIGPTVRAQRAVIDEFKSITKYL